MGLFLHICIPILAIITYFLRQSYLQSKLYTSLPKTNKDNKPYYDFVIVGGGTAGSLIASELASSFPHHSILLLEAGLPLRNHPLSEQSLPIGAPYNVGFGNIEWGYKVESQVTPLQGNVPSGFNGRQFPIPRGKGLGGSNEANFMLHVRGTKGDYTEWERMTGGDTRWGPESMASAEREYEERIVFASKAEQRRVDADDDVGGGGGSSQRVPSSHAHTLAEDWVKAAGESKYGRMVGSYNDPDVRRDGAFHYEHAVRDGVRQSTARQFLLPRMELDNLDVVVGANVEQILFDTGEEVGNGDDGVHAKGVMVTLDRCIVPSFSIPLLGTLIPEYSCLFGGRKAKDVGRKIEIPVRKEIILSAGAYATPHLLLKSGIGPKEELEAAGVKTVVDLPGVGKDLQDHPMLPMKYRLGKEGGVWVPKSAGTLSLGIPSTILSYLFRREGIISSSGCDMGYFGTSTSLYEGRPDIQLHNMITAGDSFLFEKLMKYSKWMKNDVGVPSDYGLFSQGLMFGPTLLHAKARGEVRLRPVTANTTSHDPIIEYEAFHEDKDLDRLIEGIRRVQNIMTQPSMVSHEPTLLHSRSLSEDFGADSDEYWRQYIKRFGFVVYHPTGTCKMGTVDEPMSVVDPKLRVIGIRSGGSAGGCGLRVADASVMPDITSGNTQVPTAAIGVQMVRILKDVYG